MILDKIIFCASLVCLCLNFAFALVNGKILNIKPNAGSVQGHYSIIFKSLATVQQCTSNSVCLSFQFHAHCSIWLPQLVLHHRLNFYLFHL